MFKKVAPQELKKANKMVQEKLKNIKLLLLDVDGVLTDGRITFTDDGRELKSFHSKDGVGLKLLRHMGIQAGIVTARTSPIVARRCKELGIDLIFEGVHVKADVLPAVIERTGLQPAEIAYMGDDLIDVGLMKKVALGIAPADAHEVVLAQADLVTKAIGGGACVREACDIILKAQGLWARAVNEILGDTSIEPR